MYGSVKCIHIAIHQKFKTFSAYKTETLCPQTLIFFFCSTKVWTQDPYLEPLHQPYFFVIDFFPDRVSWTIYPGWLWLLLISASWVAKITDVNH
jgi:hypothetical protein